MGHRSGGVYRFLLGLGYGGDGIKIGGGRFNPASSDISPLGWNQGGQGGLFNIPYAPNSFGDFLVESFAGVHDYLNSSIFYDSANGNIRNNISPTMSFIGQVANGVNVLIAAPFVVSSLILPTRNTFE
jgi:hypothetical protein